MDGLPEGLELYRTIGYTVLPTSVKAVTGIEQLRALLTGRTTVLAGSSGVGKSVLLSMMARYKHRFAKWRTSSGF